MHNKSNIYILISKTTQRQQSHNELRKRFCRLKHVVPVCHIQSVHGLLVLRSLTSDEVEALVVFDGVQQFLFECLLISVLGQIQQVKACVRYGEILLSATGGLDH